MIEPIFRPFEYCPKCGKYIAPGFSTAHCPHCNEDFTLTFEYRKALDEDIRILSKFPQGAISYE